MTTVELDRHAVAWSPNHHGRHERLISVPAQTPATGRIDAIILPTARAAHETTYAASLAARLDCTLVALCSQWSMASEVFRIARSSGAKAAVIDTRRLPAALLPRFATDRLLAGTRFRRTTDTSRKRNLGLLIAQLCGWERVVFLDDDIAIPDLADLWLAAGLTDRYAGVGLAIDESWPSFPDNSVVCHAFRDAGGDQGMFVGGGALVAGTASMRSFFPNIYNEDWFFLLGENNLAPVTMVGRALQRPYDPYEDGRRAQSEELGDCLAEGLFWLFDNGGSIEDADALFWAEFLDKRISFITEVTGMVHRMHVAKSLRSKMLTALRAARGRSERITPELCTRFVSAWRTDRGTWRDHVDLYRERHRTDDVEKALAALGLMAQSRLAR
jgi:hypothetical protein